MGDDLGNTPMGELDIDMDSAEQALQQAAEFVQQGAVREEQRQQLEEQQATSDQQYAAEQEDPRNKENWGAGGVVKELQSAFAGGVQDTASSLVTLPERAIDLATGEMHEEDQSAEGYDAEWDNWFVDNKNTIETNTLWG